MDLRLCHLLVPPTPAPLAAPGGRDCPPSTSRDPEEGALGTSEQAPPQGRASGRVSVIGSSVLRGSLLRSENGEPERTHLRRAERAATAGSAALPAAVCCGNSGGPGWHRCPGALLEGQAAHLEFGPGPAPGSVQASRDLARGRRPEHPGWRDKHVAIVPRTGGGALPRAALSPEPFLGPLS